MTKEGNYSSSTKPVFSLNEIEVYQYIRLEKVELVKVQ